METKQKDSRHDDRNGKRHGLQSKCRDVICFARGSLRHPWKVGWLLSSSRFLVNEVLSQIDWVKASVIVEYGPGVGTFTVELLRRMRPDAQLIALEINPRFVEYLRGSLNVHACPYSRNRLSM